MEIIILIAMVVFGFIAGYFTGKRNHSYTGTIVLGKNDEGDDRIVFNLGMEYDDIAKHDELIFKVFR